MKQDPNHRHTSTAATDRTTKNDTLYKSQACMVPPESKPIWDDDTEPETITETVQRAASSSTTPGTSTTTPTEPEPDWMG